MMALATARHIIASSSNSTMYLIFVHRNYFAKIPANLSSEILVFLIYCFGAKKLVSSPKRFWQ
jgi:hypothetical protein